MKSLKQLSDGSRIQAMKKSLRGFECLCCCLQCSAEEQPDEQEEGSWQPGRPSSISFTAARRTCLLPGSYQVDKCWAGCSSALSFGSFTHQTLFIPEG